MILATIQGNVVATRKHSSLNGWRMVICQPIDGAGKPEGTPQIAIDPHGAALHQRVVITSDGSAARDTVADDNSPVRWMVLGIIDETNRGRARTE